MLDCETAKQQEKRGRFLIQEVEEDYSSTSHKIKFKNSEKLKSNLLTTNCSKRTKHSSIIMDSKIFHTTRVDSNYSNVLFTCLIYEEKINEWVDFDPIWKQFSKVHGDLCEDDMEKIFHYIDNKIDDSDFFCMNTYTNPNLQSHVEKNIISEDKGKICDDANKSIECSNTCTAFTTELVKKTENFSNSNRLSESEKNLNKNEIVKIKSIHNKSLFLTNFFDHPIISPAVSPINSNGKFMNFKKDFCEKNKIAPVKKYSVDLDVNMQSDKFKIRRKFFLGGSIDVSERNLEICKNFSLTILSCEKRIEKINFENFIVNNTTQLEIKTDTNFILHGNNRCLICKNNLN